MRAYAKVRPSNYNTKPHMDKVCTPITKLHNTEISTASFLGQVPRMKAGKHILEGLKALEYERSSESISRVLLHQRSGSSSSTMAPSSLQQRQA